ncbi:MAG: FAD-dependent oxidoreductase [Christensenellales bacterium]|jgi:hypothetical protein
MKTIIEAAKTTPLLYKADVIVIGGGAAGIGAALSAARNGAKTVILERFGFFGGCQTLTFNNSFSFVDDRIQGGIIKEILERLEAAGATYESNAGCIKDYWSRKEGCFYFDQEYYKFLVDNMMKEAGVKVLFHTLAVDAIKEGNKLKGVIVESLEGRHAILGKVIIDCTGIAHVAWKSGARCVGDEGYPDDKYGPYKGRHMGYGYGFFLRGLDYDKFRAYAEENPEDWDYWVRGRKLFVKAKAEGKLYMQRNSCLMIEYKDGHVWLIGPTYAIPEGKHPWMLEMLSAGEVDLRKQAWSTYKVLKENVPGFENTKIEQTPTSLMLRDTHRIVGEYTLTEEDIRSGRTFDDSITCSNMPTDLFFPDGTHRFKHDITPYDIPYRCLLSVDYDNLITAGGVISCDIFTWSAIRYCTVSVCTGQAAGLAAAIASKNNITPKEFDVRLLQDELNRQGMITSNRQVPNEVIGEYRRRAGSWGKGLKL